MTALKIARRIVWDATVTTVIIMVPVLASIYTMPYWVPWLRGW